MFISVRITIVFLFLLFPLILLSTQRMPHNIDTSLIAKEKTRYSVDPYYEALEPLIGTWYISDINHAGLVNNTLIFSEVSYSEFYAQFIAKGLDQNGYQAQCLVDEGAICTSNHSFICWNFESDDGLNDTYYSLSFVSNNLQGIYYKGEINDAFYALSEGLGQSVVASHTQQSSQEEIIHSSLTTLKNTLLSRETYNVSGSFATYDFPGVDQAFDWIFTTPTGKVYQLQGNASSSNDVFGWKAVNVIPNTPPAWYMSYLDDWDNDGTGKYDWILVGNGFNAVYKLEGVTATGNFAYSNKIDVDYIVSADKKSITFGGTPDDNPDDEPLPPGSIEGYWHFIENWSVTNTSEDNETIPEDTQEESNLFSQSAYIQQDENIISFAFKMPLDEYNITSEPIYTPRYGMVQDSSISFTGPFINQQWFIQILNRFNPSLDLAVLASLENKVNCYGELTENKIEYRCSGIFKLGALEGAISGAGFATKLHKP